MALAVVKVLAITRKVMARCIADRASVAEAMSRILSVPTATLAEESLAIAESP